MSHQLILTHPQRAVWTRLLGSLVLIVQVLTTAYARHPVSAISLSHVPVYGFPLKEGWRFQAGDNPNGASPQLDDSQWSSIDPTKDIRDLPSLQQAPIGWLRLHLHTGNELPPLMMKVFQSVASEIYLDGRLLYRFGSVSANPDRVQAYNPSAAFNLPLQVSSDHVLAIRVACQPGKVYAIKYLHWDAAAIQLWLFPTTALPAFKPSAIQEIYLSTFKIGTAFILFILHLSLFFAHHTQRTNLYAAGMYWLLCITFFARTANDFTHSLGWRMVIHYASFVDAWVPGMALLTFYSLFNFRKGWLCWLAIGSIGLRFVELPADYQWLHIVFDYYLQFELIRLSVVATRRRLLGAHIVTMGALVNLGLWITGSIISALRIPYDGHEWLYNTFYVLSFLCFPLTLSLRLALEHGWVNRQLMTRLQEVEKLSARNLAQQQERQQLMALQNEQLEQQVAERTQELHQQADQLRQLDQVKSRFVTNITHEFRTPLSLILSPVEKLLQERRFDGSMLTLVQRNAEQLLQLINQLLDLSKLEGNYMAIFLVQGEVADFINQIVAVFRRAAEQKDIRLTCSVGQFPPQAHAFDADKWGKILTNLLANALKYTPSGGRITLTLAPVWKADEMSGVQIQVADSGIGITSEELPHIFDRFYQADTSSTRAYGGTGIGLALVKELINVLEGAITVESEPGVGTTFRLTLPVQSLATSLDVPAINGCIPKLSVDTLLSPPTPAPAPNPTGEEDLVPRILVVEDNDELREFLVSELSHSYHVLQAVDGEAGWMLTQSELPDIVLTDVMMPHIDGYELTQLIKGHAHTDHIAVVMLTAKVGSPSRLEGLQLGADDYLSKPFSMDELTLRVQNLLSRQRRLQERLRAQLLQPQPASSPEKSQPDTDENPFLLRTYDLLDQHLGDCTLSVEDLASQLNLDRTSLHRKVKALTGMSASELIRSYRLKRAAKFLRQGLTSTETCYKTGFDSPAYFTRCFREQYNMTPTEYIQVSTNTTVSGSLPIPKQEGLS